MTGVSRLDRVRNEVVRVRTDVRRELAARGDMNVLRWFDHVMNVVWDAHVQAFVTYWTAKFFLNSTEVPIILTSCTTAFTVVQSLSEAILCTPLMTDHNQKELVFLIVQLFFLPVAVKKLLQIGQCWFIFERMLLVSPTGKSSSSFLSIHAVLERKDCTFIRWHI